MPKRFVMKGGWNRDVASRAQPLKQYIFVICDFIGSLGGQTVLKSKSHRNIFFRTGNDINLITLNGFYDRAFSTHQT